MIGLRLHSIACNEDTDEWAKDDPYVLVVSASIPMDANSARLPACDVTVYPFKDMDDNSRPSFGSPGHRFSSFWGLGGVGANLSDTDEAVFIVGMMENDEGDPHVVRGTVAAAAAASLARSLTIARTGKIQMLTQDIETARRVASTGGALVNNDDPIGDLKELRFSRDDLERAEQGEIVLQTMAFDGDGGRYTLEFEAFSQPSGVEGTFDVGVPPKSLMAMKAFQYRAYAAAAAGFGAGFPNFYEAVYGRDHVGGTILLNADAMEWRDVPISALGNVPLEDFEQRLRATNQYATENGFVGGFPNFLHADYGNGIVCGSVLLKPTAAEWRDVELSELGNPALGDFEQRFRSTQDFALRNGFVGGFPNLFHAEKQVIDFQTGRRTQKTFCGTVLLKAGTAEWRDILLFQDPA